MKKMKSDENGGLLKIQANVPAELLRRAKAIAAFQGVGIAELVENLLEDFVERNENDFLGDVLARRLADAHAGKPVTEIPNLKTYYEQVSKEKE